MPVWLQKARAILTKVTDWLFLGRKAGLWDIKDGISSKENKLNSPSQVKRPDQF